MRGLTFMNPRLMQGTRYMLPRNFHPYVSSTIPRLIAAIEVLGGGVIW